MNKTPLLSLRSRLAILTLSATMNLVAADPVNLPAVSPSTSPSPSPAATASSKKPRTEQDAITPTVKDRKRHQNFLDRIKDGKVDLLFLGDSITDGWPRVGELTWLKFAPYSPADFGVSGDRTEHVLWRITNGELEGIAPKVTVIMIGTNNIGQLPDEKPEWAAAGVKKIVETVHEKLPQTKILLLAVFPRGTKTSPQRSGVDAINKILSSEAVAGSGTRFLDLSKTFLDENGEIPADVMPDLLHPTAKGYGLWYEAMRPVLEEMMK